MNSTFFKFIIYELKKHRQSDDYDFSITQIILYQEKGCSRFKRRSRRS
jgi:hypothetical protein